MKNLPTWLKALIWIITIIALGLTVYYWNPYNLFGDDGKDKVAMMSPEQQKCYDDSVRAADLLEENARLMETVTDFEARIHVDSVKLAEAREELESAKERSNRPAPTVNLNPLEKEVNGLRKSINSQSEAMDSQAEQLEEQARQLEEQAKQLAALKAANENRVYTPVQQQTVREEPRARVTDPVVTQRNVVTEGTNDGVNERLTNGGPSLSPTNTVFSQYRLSVIFGDDSLLTYSFTKAAYEAAGGNETPELNNRGTGKFFTLVGDSLYVYKDASRKGRPGSRIRQGFTAYIGDGKGWPAFLVHELLKPTIAHALGSTLAGYITPEVLRKMAEVEPMIAAGKLLPNRPAVRQLPDSTNHWEGWYYSE